MKREELYIYGDGETATYQKSEADSVMDAMEARIKELESQLENVQNTMATENVDLGMENNKLKERIKELEAAMQKERDFGLHIARCADHDIAKLASENARLKAQVPKWHDLTKPLPCYVDEDGNDVYDLPVEDEADANGDVYTIHKCGACGTEQWDEIDPEVIAMWCKLPQPPTEESSATEKENG